MKKFIYLFFALFLFGGFSINQPKGCTRCSRIVYFKNGTVMKFDSIEYSQIGRVEMLEAYNLTPYEKYVFPYSTLKSVQYADTNLNRLAKNLFK